ncbi:hypothetical protein ACP70R_012192 [Stipagrostis hirtigluma subsp. patula]
MMREKRPDLLTKVWTVVEPMITKPPVASWTYSQSTSGRSCAPAHFFCPILKEFQEFHRKQFNSRRNGNKFPHSKRALKHEIMSDPQMASDGFTYEVEAIRHWLDDGNNRSPMTNLVLQSRSYPQFCPPFIHPRVP